MFVSLKGLLLKRFASLSWKQIVNLVACSPCYCRVLDSISESNFVPSATTCTTPKIPKDLVRPTVVAGVNALGRGQDYQSLTQFITTIAQTMGPEAIQRYIDPAEYIKRLATAQGIDTLNLVKTQEQMQQEMQQQMQMQEQQELTKQAAAMQKVNVDQQKADVESAQALSEIEGENPSLQA